MRLLCRDTVSINGTMITWHIVLNLPYDDDQNITASTTQIPLSIWAGGTQLFHPLMARQNIVLCNQQGTLQVVSEHDSTSLRGKTILKIILLRATRHSYMCVMCVEYAYSMCILYEFFCYV
ncbi:uncharacterized protein LOC131046032 isoform X2 [Cryptomeria japonica]|uniref:uncharacterized protein LOC131046032 isoform X2 n=1 Tax=Cryptomeria japonica TaxID=3369 RepID=UPI0025AC12DB|nr:uncharacterized protein LOC131046032 isoform X2 [Cryptomeria japonica]